MRPIMTKDSIGNKYLLFKENINMITYRDKTLAIFYRKSQILVFTTDKEMYNKIIESKPNYPFFYLQQQEYGKLYSRLRNRIGHFIRINDQANMEIQLHIDQLNFVVFNPNVTVLSFKNNQMAFLTSNPKVYMKLKNNPGAEIVLLISDTAKNEIDKQLDSLVPKPIFNDIHLFKEREDLIQK
jgi:hypothetical protein